MELNEVCGLLDSIRENVNAINELYGCKGTLSCRLKNPKKGLVLIDLAIRGLPGISEYLPVIKDWLPQQVARTVPPLLTSLLK